MPAELLVVVVPTVRNALKPVMFNAPPLPAVRLRAPRERAVRPEVEPAIVIMPPPFSVVPLKVGTLLLPVAAVRPVMVRVPEPRVNAVLAGRMLLIGPVVDERLIESPPWLRVVEPV